jgi:hypothetical protein
LQKKKQKNSYMLGAVAPNGQMPTVTRSFLFLFFKKEALSSMVDITNVIGRTTGFADAGGDPRGCARAAYGGLFFTVWDLLPGGRAVACGEFAAAIAWGGLG